MFFILGEEVNTYVRDIKDDMYFTSLLKQIDESDNQTPYVVEFGKVSSMGITFLASSDGAGALSSSDTCGKNTEYVATFPASNVYVTTIGGVSGGVQSDTSVDPDGSETAWSHSDGAYGSYCTMSGTFCSCTTIAGMIALINDARMASGKSKSRWLNPAIYGLYNSDNYTISKEKSSNTKIKHLNQMKSENDRKDILPFQVAATIAC